MSKKTLLILALMAFLTSAKAENDGFFIGAAFPTIALPIAGVALTKNEIKHKNNGTYGTRLETSNNFTLTLINLAFGYSHALGERLGLRYYGSIYTGIVKFINTDFNIDVLFTLIKGESTQLRAFAGGWAGWENYLNEGARNSGLDLGINAGLRLVLAQRHGVELFGRFGFLSQNQNYDAAYTIKSWKIKQPYSIGVRYTFSF